MDSKKHIELLKSLNAREICVGFSGGADSTALLIMLKHYSEELPFAVKAVHFQHNLRGQESVEDAAWCRQFCENMAVDFTEVSLDVSGSQQPGEGVEAAARRLRNDYWLKNAAGEKSFVALGHHADDRAENLILRLCRGSNVTGLTSMRPVQEIGAVTYIRPLLVNSRDEVIQFLSDNNVTDWRHDASNDDVVFKRNFIRHSIMPELHSSLEYSKVGIQHSLKALSDDADFVESEAVKKYDEIAGCSKVSVTFLSELHPAILIRVLRYWLREQLGYEVLPNHRLIVRLNVELNRKETGETKTIPVDGNVSLKIRRGDVVIAQKYLDSTGEKVPPVLWNWKEQPSIKWNGIVLTAEKSDSIPENLSNVACFDADSLPETLIIRTWEPGDTMVPFGRKTPVKLKKLFSEKKVSAENKANYPLICDSSMILWIPAVRRSNTYTVSDKKDIVQLACER